MLLKISAEDLKAGLLPEPAWYEVLIEKVEDKPSKDGQSMNYWLKGKIVKNADNGDTKFAGVPTPFLWMINSKGSFAMVPILRALGKELQPDMEVDPMGLAGKRLEMFIGNQPDQQGIMRSSVTGQYRPLRELVAQG